MGRIRTNILPESQRASRSSQARRGYRRQGSSIRAVSVSLCPILPSPGSKTDTTRRASAVYRIARFPIPRSEKQRYAWEQGKFACLAGLQPSVSEEWISVSDESLGSTDKPDGFPLYCRVPDTATPAQPAPVVIILTGLDGYRTELAVWMQGFADVGVATLVLEIPGTGDAMPDPRKPQQFDDMWPAVFAWIANHTRLDANSKLIWGFSTGGYYAIRLAHKHADELKGVVALGGGCHYM